MFTGIIQEVGAVQALEPRDPGARLTVACGTGLARELETGASVAVNGACLTVVAATSETFSADLAPETLKRTNLGSLTHGLLVNLERPLQANARLDGHFVLGHIDATAGIESLEELGDGNWWLRIFVPEDLTRYVVSKGSLAVDGISLTVAEVQDTLVGFTIIPHTYAHTALKNCRAGGRVNIEVDILAKHVEKLLSSRGQLSRV